MTWRGALGGVVAVAVVGAAAVAGWLWASGGAIQVTDNAYLRADAIVVAPRIEGHLAEIRVRENQPVAKGDVLVRVDETRFRARVEQSVATRQAKRAQVDGDRATITSIEAQRALQGSIIEQARASEAAAIAEAERARLDYERYRSLTATNASTAQRLESATSDHLKADAERRRAAAQVAADEQRLAVFEADRLKAEARLAQSQAELDEAEAAVALVRADLDDTRLTAPFDGVVGNMAARTGQYVRPGLSLLTLVPRRPYVVANFKETQLARMRPGQSARITVDAFPGLDLAARVESFAPATGSEFSLLPPENATGNFTKVVQRIPVRLELLGLDGRTERLASGMSVVVAVDTASPGCEGDCTPAPAAPGSGPAPADERPKTSRVLSQETTP